MDVATVMGTGHDNTEYQEDGSELGILKQIVFWSQVPFHTGKTTECFYSNLLSSSIYSLLEANTKVL